MFKVLILFLSLSPSPPLFSLSLSSPQFSTPNPEYQDLKTPNGSENL
jgi:hypothetical protein